MSHTDRHDLQRDSMVDIFWRPVGISVAFIASVATVTILVLKAVGVTFSGC